MRTAKNPVERRLQEVDASRDEVRAEIKRLQRALKNPERLLAHSHLLPTTPPAAAGPRLRGTPPAETPAATAGEPAACSGAPAPGAERHIPVSGNETFARYFSSTRFLGSPALGRERSVQRNRAILLVVIALVFGFIVYKLIAR